MAESYVLKSDAGILTHVIHGNSQVLVQDSQECGDILERCAASRNEEDRFIWNRRAVPFRPVMEIPLAIINDYKRRGIDLMSDQTALRIFINDPANKKLRLSTGRV